MERKTELSKPLDRRIQRSRKLLFDALIKLIIEKGYEKVTIQDIIDRADVGRSTFYAHFESKEQLLFSGEDFTQGHLFADLAPGRSKYKFSPLEKFTLVYEHVEKHILVSKALLAGKDATPMLDHARQTLRFIAESTLKKQNLLGNRQKMLEFEVSACTEALLRLLICWIADDRPFPVAEMAEKSVKMMERLLEV